LPSHRLPDSLYQEVARDARHQCGYCRVPQSVLPYRLEIEHLQPRSLGGSNEHHNLWLSCHKCNRLRSNRMELTDPLTGRKVPVFNPRHNDWSAHFTWELDGLRVVGLTACGRATVETLRLNDQYHLTARMVWISAGRYPP